MGVLERLKEQLEGIEREEDTVMRVLSGLIDDVSEQLKAVGEDNRRLRDRVEVLEDRWDRHING